MGERENGKGKREKGNGAIPSSILRLSLLPMNVHPNKQLHSTPSEATSAQNVFFKNCLFFKNGVRIGVICRNPYEGARKGGE
jgi:hypothetical protein